MDKKLYYDDVALVPGFSKFKSRSEIDVSCNIDGIKFRLPVIPANMKCVIDEKIAHFLSSNLYFYIMHRFDVDNYKFVKHANENSWRVVSISVGVKDKDKDDLLKIHNDNLIVNFITIDIAHGHSQIMKEMIEYVKSLFPRVTIIAGNVCTADGYSDIVNWGADIVKVGVGPGAACTTKLKTGFTYPMFSCIKEISNHRDYLNFHAPIIADGGISHNGDIAKALVAGADYVMCGKLFSECIDSPAPYINGKKLYYGSASEHNKGHSNNIEGKLIQVEQNGMTVKQKLEEITQDLQSSVSYSGKNSLSELWLTDWVVI